MRGSLPDISPSSGAFRATFPPRGRLLRRGGVTPPATVFYNEYNGLVRRGGIYAARCSHPDISIYRANRKGRIYASPTNRLFMGCFPVGAGHAPPAVLRKRGIYGLPCRGGIYAARCSRSGKSTERLSRTGRIYASPTNRIFMGCFPVGGGASPAPGFAQTRDLRFAL